MIKQQSFKNEKPTLFLVATPIGNLNEMTPRAIEILKTVDIIAAEDTRNARKLCSHFEINTKMISHHMHNEQESTKGIIDLLESGMNIGLVSDAGYPLISDPGQTLVRDVIAAGYNVVPISGSSAFLNALVASGLIVQPFAFMGFMEHKEGQLKKQLIQHKDLPMTTIYYLSVHKLEKTLEIVYDVLGNRKICLVREITKMHEEFIRGTVTEVMESVETIKGEFVIVIEANTEVSEVSFDDLIIRIKEQINAGSSVSRSISSVAKENGVSKNELYSYYHENK
ncbi:16S rRNA (cytidine(1402)-2'-O)-methyltransferase [Erysipelothrix rhusiopathiae]|uniref:16S rRNA (cytidine(1402)-2'-O)-methyltransferase n=1 Tax=Erysipelothrix rhusiopathiae TaxID=1648 RepID=UPI000F435FC5|nr:16S rRNA (cytidine(1402)-2'-O)-methyltransferase [Erysipelothrix rhusiopathiae]AYV33834.1 16S rRNA (cytidine(1402)-2'-O)-methyltransferase [Erysipelothrix rhusiopathiae]MDE8081432.1 16S rRNA (cytidine(1402)-2'-O)-methyltransferase [Erysipelothrix rhusiopathiae]MDE8314061.1 16S rRNA (cytidine(1402)-2'-O)-methyltransferase [Erysipelothrix rhusiopathiae]MDE8328656.1 16S rRNA (cytidine(1402)-2'-O)-methyltransferase [Erysipelothrix rhusiopathiae]